MYKTPTFAEPQQYKTFFLGSCISFHQWIRQMACRYSAVNEKRRKVVIKMLQKIKLYIFPIRLCKLQKGCTRLAAASDKVYQLLAHGRWFSPGTPDYSTTKTGRHDIAEILLKMALKHQKSNQIFYINNKFVFSFTHLKTYRFRKLICDIYKDCNIVFTI